MSAHLRYFGLLLAFFLTAASAEVNSAASAPVEYLLDTYLEILDDSFGEISALVKSERRNLLQSSGPNIPNSKLLASYVRILESPLARSEPEKLLAFIENSRSLYEKIISGPKDALTTLEEIGDTSVKWTLFHIAFFKAHADLFPSHMQDLFDFALAVFSPDRFPTDGRYNTLIEGRLSAFLASVKPGNTILPAKLVIETNIRGILPKTTHFGEQSITIGFAFAAGKYARAKGLSDEEIFEIAELLRATYAGSDVVLKIPISFDQSRRNGEKIVLFRHPSEDILWAALLNGACPTESVERTRTWKREVFSRLQGAVYGGRPTTLGLVARIDISEPKEFNFAGTHDLGRNKAFEALSWDMPQLWAFLDSELNKLLLDSARSAIQFGASFDEIAPPEEQPELWQNLLSNVEMLGLSWDEVRVALRARLESARDVTTFRALAIAADHEKVADLIRSAATAHHERFADSMSSEEWGSLAGAKAFDLDTVLRLNAPRYFISSLVNFLDSEDQFRFPRQIEIHARTIGDRIARASGEEAEICQLVRVVNQRPIPQMRSYLEHQLAKTSAWKLYLVWKLRGWYSAIDRDDQWATGLLKEIQGGLALGHVSEAASMIDILIEVFEELLTGNNPSSGEPYAPLVVLSGLLSILTLDNEPAMHRLDAIVAAVFKSDRSEDKDALHRGMIYGVERAYPANNGGELVAWKPKGLEEMKAKTRGLRECGKKLLRNAWDRLPWWLRD